MDGPGSCRLAVIGVSLVIAASLAAGGCGSSSNSSTPSCFTKAAAAGSSSAPGAAGKSGTPSSPAATRAAAGWTQPGGNLQNTRDVASAINNSNVSKLGVAWTVPIKANIPGHEYATTPVVVNGVIYTQDLESNVMAIELATGKVLWTHTYNSLNGGPDGVTVAGGTVYAATNHGAVALSAATGRPLWSRTLTGNDHEGIDMTPGYNNGTVYVSTVPVNPAVGEYLGHAKATLWALNARTGTPEWDDKLPSSPYGAATVTNNVVFTTTYNGDLYAFNTATGAVLLKTPLSAGSNAPVTVDGDYVIAGAGVASSSTPRPLIIAYKLGAKGKLPDTVGS